jgi:hypothetical protein
MSAFSSGAFSTDSFSVDAFDFGAGPPPPPPVVDDGVRPSGGVPGYDRGPSKEQKRRSRVLFGLEKEIVEKVAQRQSEDLRQDDLQRKEELLRELKLARIEASSVHYVELARHREELISEEIRRRLQQVLKADEEAAAMLIMIAAGL